MKIKQVPETTPKSSKILAIKLGIFHQKLCNSSYYCKSMSEELLCYIYWCKVVLKAAA